MLNNEIIDVLLGTYNGEKYIEEFLVSLVNQSGVKIRLFVSDDGSTDSTLEIVQKFGYVFDELTILNGPKKGPMANYFFLLHKSKSNYVAFADQDDIWHHDHLSQSLLRILDSEKPSLAFSSTNQFGANQGLTQVWPPRSVKPNFPGALFENIGRGCSFVMNAKARDLINLYQPSRAIMHDWWIYLVISLKGNIEYSPYPELDYRIHNDNFVGINSKKKFLFLKTIKRGQWEVMDQIEELVYGASLGDSKYLTFDIEEFVSKLNSGILNRLKLVATRGVSYRMHKIDDVIIRIGFVFLPIVTRNMRHQRG